MREYQKGPTIPSALFCCPAPRVSSHTLLSPIHSRRRRARDDRRTQLNPALNGRNQGSANAGIRDASVTSTIECDKTITSRFAKKGVQLLSGGQKMQTHPKGVRARVLLSSVFGPYAQDDEFGSRSINPMELYHNQIGRAQGAFSLRMFHRSWGIMMIQANIPAPTTVLDFPTREVFERELREHDYDIVGITSIIVNVGKVREMCRIVREISPRSTVVVGGHVTAIPAIETMINADFIVRGEGISWMRRFLGLDDKAPIVHPAIASGFGHRDQGNV